MAPLARPPCSNLWARPIATVTTTPGLGPSTCGLASDHPLLHGLLPVRLSIPTPSSPDHPVNGLDSGGFLRLRMGYLQATSPHPHPLQSGISKLLLQTSRPSPYSLPRSRSGTLTLVPPATCPPMRFGATIQGVQCDNGREFDNLNFRTFFSSNGVHLRTTHAGTLGILPGSAPSSPAPALARQQAPDSPCASPAQLLPGNFCIGSRTKVEEILKALLHQQLAIMKCLDAIEEKLQPI
ncbi:hypothetical protein GUJ93_ZPchr0010g9517 [Zizania palustris]|uniref:Uncharacterized protein n=1 Tax=Zizania palustris TaxID=103762 RepID=A0A8J6BN05_ZIZPA|nr:hypothetical protein GUJ93_ZPchr0010g9517 [Zizania palustris]